MYEQLDIFSFIPKVKVFNPGDWVEKDVMGEKLTFNEITHEVGNLIILDKSAYSHEWYEVVRVEKIVIVEGNQRRLIYYDGTRERGLINEIFFDEQALYPYQVKAYRIGG